jgi:adenylyl-sulfate kinase
MPMKLVPRGGVVWLTGLSGAGKTTIARGAAAALEQEGYPVVVLDGDALRDGLSADLGFSREDRLENIRRIGEVARLFAENGLLCIVAAISPYAAARGAARARIGSTFHEIFIAASPDVCESRDPKGLYARARRGEIAEFTGISSPYEPPTSPDLLLDTASMPPAASIAALVEYVRARFSAPDPRA